MMRIRWIRTSRLSLKNSLSAALSGITTMQCPEEARIAGQYEGDHYEYKLVKLRGS